MLGLAAATNAAESMCAEGIVSLYKGTPQVEV